MVWECDVIYSNAMMLHIALYIDAIIVMSMVKFIY